MQVTKKELDNGLVELLVELPSVDVEKYLEKAAELLSADMKIEGFRPGKVPVNILKAKIGEMALWEEACRMTVNKSIDSVIQDNISEAIFGRPEVVIIKAAPANPLEYKITVTLLPKVELDNYQGLNIVQEKIEATDEDVQKTIDHLAEAQIQEKEVERAIQDGDKFIASIEMFVDKVPVEGGQSKDVAILMGKDYVIPGFDKNLLGAKKGDTREFAVVYPADHYQKNLAGKSVDFVVKISDVFERQLPEMNDVFAAKFGVKDLAELKKNIKENILQEREHQMRDKAEIEMLSALVERAKFTNIPEEMIDNEVHAMLHELEHNVKQYGGKFEDYLASIHKTIDQLHDDMEPEAQKRVKSALIIRHVFEKEAIKVEEKDIDEEVEKLLTQYKGYEKVEARVKSKDYRFHLANVLANRKVLAKLRDWNIK